MGNSEESERDTIFVRHKMTVTRKIIEWLWRNRRIALHWLNSSETDPDFYSREKCGSNRAFTEMNYLNKYSEEGAIVGAYYGNKNEKYRGKMLVGKISPNSRIKIEKFDNPRGDEELVCKTVQLVDTKEIGLSDCPALFTAKPQQGWSICKWHKGERLLRAIASGSRELEHTVKSLSAGQLEVVCNMFLKSRESDYYNLMPIGRTLEIVDIVAINNEEDKKILAQVTHGDNIKEKLELLRNHAKKDVKLYFFGPENAKPPEKELEDLEYIPIEKVFEKLTSDKGSSSYKTIKHMLSLPDP